MKRLELNFCESSYLALLQFGRWYIYELVKGVKYSAKIPHMVPTSIS